MKIGDKFEIEDGVLIVIAVIFSITIMCVTAILSS